MAYVTNSMLARGTAVLLITAALPGCLPLGAPTIISLALDGISVMATGKTVADHALSELAQQDCSVGRAVFTGTDVCYEDQEQPVVALQDVPDNASIALAPASGPADTGPDADLPDFQEPAF